MLPGEALCIVCSVYVHVLRDVAAELLANGIKHLFVPAGPHEPVGEVGVAAGAVPVTGNWLRMEIDPDIMLLSDALEDESRGPKLVTGVLSSFREDLARSIS